MKIRVFVSLIIISLFCLINSSLSQVEVKIDQNTNFFYQRMPRIGTDTWAAGGATIASSENQAAAFINPAGLKSDEINFYAEFGKWKASKWIADIDLKLLTLAPCLVSIGIPYKKLSIAFGYVNLYEHRLSSSVTSISGSIHFEQKIKNQIFFGSAGFPLNKKISAGITLGLNYLSHEEQSVRDINAHGYGMTLIAGLLAKPFENFAVACNMKYFSKIEYDGTYKYDESIYIDPSMIGENDILLTSAYNFQAKLPYTFSIGVMHKPLHYLDLSASIEYQKWSHYIKNYNDTFDIHFGATVKIEPTIKSNFGYFSQISPLDGDIGLPDQHFLTAGIQLELIEMLSISANIMDSHLFKKKGMDDAYYQTYSSMGVSLKF